MIIRKKTYGFVIQKFDTDSNIFISQEFVSQGEIVWERDEPELAEGSDILQYAFPFTMLQPYDGREY